MLTHGIPPDFHSIQYTVLSPPPPAVFPIRPASPAIPSAPVGAVVAVAVTASAATGAPVRLRLQHDGAQAHELRVAVLGEGHPVLVILLQKSADVMQAVSFGDVNERRQVPEETKYSDGNETRFLPYHYKYDIT